MKLLTPISAALVAAVAVSSIGCLIALPAGSQTSTSEALNVDAGGNIRVPDDYRRTYEYLGTWSVAGDDKGAKQMHTVYASPGTAEAYRSTGQFPDGSVLVKEVYGTSTATMTTGTVSRVDQLQGWFVMVKDSKNSHPDNKLWGNGWGWSWFDAGNPTKTTSTDFRANCLGCHIPAKATDWIYVAGYSVLNR